MGGKHGPPEWRFWRKVSKGAADECWEWRGGRCVSGYGAFGIRSSTSMPAHRFSYELHKGAIPQGMQVCHSCDNRACVNPAHLWLGTKADNYADMRAKGRGAKGSRMGAAKLVEGDIPDIRFLLATGASLREVGERFGVHGATINDIKQGRTWRHVEGRA